MRCTRQASAAARMSGRLWLGRAREDDAVEALRARDGSRAPRAPPRPPPAGSARRRAPRRAAAGRSQHHVEPARHADGSDVGTTKRPAARRARTPPSPSRAWKSARSTPLGRSRSAGRHAAAIELLAIALPHRHDLVAAAYMRRSSHSSSADQPRMAQGAHRADRLGPEIADLEHEGHAPQAAPQDPRPAAEELRRGGDHDVGAAHEEARQRRAEHEREVVQDAPAVPRLAAR